MQMSPGAAGMTDLVRVAGDEEAERRLERLALQLSDLRSFWPRVVPLFISWMARQFESEGGFGGDPWAPLAPATVERKAALGLRPQILQATGQLRQAASRPDRKASPRSLILTIDDSGPAHDAVASFHQEGTSTMPARPLIFAQLPIEAEAELQAVADRYVAGLVARL